jgi:hypothetical protein
VGVTTGPTSHRLTLAHRLFIARPSPSPPMCRPCASPSVVRHRTVPDASVVLLWLDVAAAVTAAITWRDMDEEAGKLVCTMVTHWEMVVCLGGVKGANSDQGLLHWVSDLSHVPSRQSPPHHALLHLHPNRRHLPKELPCHRTP